MICKKILQRFSKVTDIKSAVSQIPQNATVLAGGFGICGVPNSVIKEMAEQ